MAVLGQFCYNITKRIAQLAAEQSVYKDTRQKAGEQNGRQKEGSAAQELWLCF